MKTFDIGWQFLNQLKQIIGDDSIIKDFTYFIFKVYIWMDPSKKNWTIKDFLNHQFDVKHFIAMMIENKCYLDDSDGKWPEYLYVYGINLLKKYVFDLVLPNQKIKNIDSTILKLTSKGLLKIGPPYHFGVTFGVFEIYAIYSDIFEELIHNGITESEIRKSQNSDPPGVGISFAKKTFEYLIPKNYKYYKQLEQIFNNYIIMGIIKKNSFKTQEIYESIKHHFGICQYYMLISQFYIADSKLACEFSECFRYKSCNDIIKLSRYYHLNHIFELIYEYLNKIGDDNGDNNEDEDDDDDDDDDDDKADDKDKNNVLFYGSQTIWDKIYNDEVKVDGPLPTSPNIYVAKRQAGDKGMIIILKADQKKYKSIPVTLLSGTGEKGPLFFNGERKSKSV